MPTCTCLLTAGVLVATSLGAFGPLFSNQYVYNATSLEAQLQSLGVTFPNSQLRQGILYAKDYALSNGVERQLQA